MKVTAVGPTPNLPSLTGARFVAALLIVLDHGTTIVVFSDARWTSNIGLSIGFVGMTLFFVLSGFVIYLNYAQLFRDRPLGEAVGRFAIARFARLYPLYLFYMALIMASIATGRHAGFFPQIYWWIPLMQSWFLGDGVRPLLSAVEEASITWSISTEAFFYVMFPFLCVLVFRPLRWRVRAALELPLLFVVAPLILYGLYLFMPAVIASSPQMAELQVVLWYSYFSPYPQIFTFMAGLLAARVYLELRDRPISRVEAIVAGCLAAACIAFFPLSIWLRWINGVPPIAFPVRSDSFLSFIHPSFWNVPAATFLVFYLARYSSALGRFLSSRLAIAGGEASYSIYLVHLWIVLRLMGPEREVSVLSVMEWLGRFSLYVLFTLSVAYGTYTLIEVPARRWIRNTFERRIGRPAKPRTEVASTVGSG